MNTFKTSGVTSIAIPKTFRDANYIEVAYDGSPVEWRVSIYGLVIQKNTLLTIKSTEEKFYDIPGGGVEMGEELAVALKREGLEESGHALVPKKPVWTMTDWFYHNDEKKFYRSLQMYWLAESGGVISKPTDTRVAFVDWVDLGELSTLPMYPNVLTALKAIPNYKKLVQ